jgi:hypothetical protein
MDIAPDGLAPWVYTPTAPKPVVTITPVIGVAVNSAPKLVGGKAFVVTFPVTQAETGGPLKAAGATVVVHPYLGTTVVPHTESFAAGKVKMTFTAPKTAKGKTVTVRLTVKVGSKQASKAVNLKVA